MIAALYVAKGGCYFGLEGVEPWDEARDARKYAGPWPVVAHPPCERWTNLTRLNFKRWGGEHNRPGNDGGCFAAALSAVRRHGGVLEHPAFSWAWPAHGLTRPIGIGWISGAGAGEYTCEVWQSAYGHRARKRTWLYYVGVNPQLHQRQLTWERRPGTHQVGWFDRKKPTLRTAQAAATPLAFRDALLELARSSRVIG